MDKTGGHAFPTDAYYDERRHGVEEGISKRDYFAAKAMQAFIRHYMQGQPEPQMAWIATLAFSMADAMILQRAKKDGE